MTRRTNECMKCTENPQHIHPMQMRSYVQMWNVFRVCVCAWDSVRFFLAFRHPRMRCVYVRSHQKNKTIDIFCLKAKTHHLRGARHSVSSRERNFVSELVEATDLQMASKVHNCLPLAKMVSNFLHLWVKWMFDPYRNRLLENTHQKDGFSPIWGLFFKWRVNGVIFEFSPQANKKFCPRNSFFGYSCDI